MHENSRGFGIALGAKDRYRKFYCVDAGCLMGDPVNCFTFRARRLSTIMYSATIQMHKPILLFCLKSSVFTIIFWLLWTLVLSPIVSHLGPSSESTQNAQAAAQVAAYDRQVARINHQLDVVEAQQIRMEKYLSAQEENTKRFNAILSVWEKQGSLKK
ncbi:MAG: hypothetical protein ABIT83_13310 [Massilia sp.]